jgi:hypothetical protein
MVLYGFPYPHDVFDAVKLFQDLGYIYYDIADAVELLICPVAYTIRKPVRTLHTWSKSIKRIGWFTSRLCILCASRKHRWASCGYDSSRWWAMVALASLARRFKLTLALHPMGEHPDTLGKLQKQWSLVAIVPRFACALVNNIRPTILWTPDLPSFNIPVINLPAERSLVSYLM